MKKLSIDVLKYMQARGVILLAFLFILSACNKDEFSILEEEAPATRSGADATNLISELPVITFEELLAKLATDFVEAISPVLEQLDLPGKLASKHLRTYKVSTQTPHPDGSGSMITVSGVVILPENYSGALRFVISPPPTFTENDAAPSIIFSGERDVPLLYENFLNYLYFVALNAFQGCAIFMPDYPGFGDSFGQCVHPYALKKPLIESTLDLAKVAKAAVQTLGYELKEEVIVTGYSQGGLVGTAVGHELDTNGAAHNMPLKILFAGGVPANLKAMIDIARISPYLPLSFVFPYATYGFQQNGYPEINMSELLRAPYDKKVPDTFDGYHSVVQALAAYPKSNLLLFKSAVILNNEKVASVALLNRLLEENSIAPWKNNAPVVFLHGLTDQTVYYYNVLTYIKEMKELGGTPELITAPLGHVVTIFDYLLRLPLYIADNV